MGKGKTTKYRATYLHLIESQYNLHVLCYPCSSKRAGKVVLSGPVLHMYVVALALVRICLYISFITVKGLNPGVIVDRVV